MSKLIRSYPLDIKEVNSYLTQILQNKKEIQQMKHSLKKNAFIYTNTIEKIEQEILG